MDTIDTATPAPDPAAPEPARETPRFSWPGAGIGKLAALLAAALVALVLFLPGIDRLPVTDRDEALFVQASRQMLETGNLIDIRFQAEPRYKKPAGVYWLQAASAELFGGGASAPLVDFRLPSLAGALLTVLFTTAIGALIGGPALGLVAGCLLATTIEINLEARLGKTDAVLAATVLAAEYALALVYFDPDRRRRLGRNALFWGALGLGILIKGPITPMIAGLTLLVLSLTERSTALWRALSPVRGLAFMAALALPWLIAIAYVSGGDFFVQSLGKDMLGKVVGVQQSHGAPPGTYVLASLGTFWPMVALIPLALAYGWKHRSEPAIRFLAAWVLPAWLVFEAAPTKLPNYVLPLLPGLALLVALSLRPDGLALLGRWRRGFLGYIAVGAVLIGFGLNVGYVYVEGRADLVGLALGIGLCAAGLAAWRLWAADRTGLALTATLAVALLANVLAYGVLLPGATSLWPSDRMAEAAAELKPCAAPEVFVVGYGAPSAVFRLGTDTTITKADPAATAFAEAACALAFVREADTPAFLAALATATPGAAVPVPARVISGRNLDGFKPLALQVFVRGG